MSENGRIPVVTNPETGKTILLTWEDYRTALERVATDALAEGLSEEQMRERATERFWNEYELSSAVLQVLGTNELISMLEEEKDRRTREHNSFMGKFKPQRHAGMWAGGLQRRGTVD